jgi:hypothetical protein
MLLRSTIALVVVGICLTTFIVSAEEPKQSGDQTEAPFSANPFGAEPTQSQPAPAQTTKRESGQTADLSQSNSADPGDTRTGNSSRFRSLPALSLVEQKIKLALQRDKTTLEFVEIPLSDVINFIKDRHHIAIVFDDNPLKDATIDPTALPVSINVQDISLHSALNLMLSRFNLTYLLEDDVLKITTKEKADATLTMRIYDIHDLVPLSGDAAATALNQLVDILVSTPHWHSGTEHETVKSFNSDGLCVIAVSQTQAVHEEIAQLLADLRRLKSQTPSKEKE